MSAPSFFQLAGQGDLLFWRTNSSSMGEPIRTRKGKLAGKGTHNARLGRVVQVKKRGRGNPLLRAQQERNPFLSMMKRNQKRPREEQKDRELKVYKSRQSVQYRSWWKQGNIKMTVSEDHAPCWAQKDLTVTTKQIQALLTAARTSGGKDERQVQLTCIQQKYWMGTKISTLGGYSSRGTIPAGEGSNQKEGKMGSGYVNLRGKKEKSAEALEGGMRRGRILLKPSGTSGLRLSITRHPYDKTHALFVRQPSAAKSCKKIGR